MLQEAINLQQNAVSRLITVLDTKKEITFRAPTGSGKTRMMSDFMNRVLSENDDVIFLVSTLSKGNLAKQNFDVFQSCVDEGVYPHLNPYLISSEISEEERLYIPTDYNVYVLARDLFKEKSRLMEGGVLENFLKTMTENFFGRGLNKKVFLIRDECHQETKNLSSLSSVYFTKIINMSATPNLKRGQKPDVQITDEDAESVKLIKKIVKGAEEDSVETALQKFDEIKTQYRNLLGVNPCLIIQISNKDKAEEEWNNIETILGKPEYQHLKWMSIVDKKENCKTNDKVGKLPLDKWKDYAKSNASTIDIIIFKMVISEGWDIPRACMLYQVRDTKSKQLDEQVMGRVRRNPRLKDFENLSAEAQELAMTAWVWGITPEFAESRRVKLCGSKNAIASDLQIKTTILKPLTERRDFDIEKFMDSRKEAVAHKSIFELNSKLQKCDTSIKKMCYDYAGNDVAKWNKFCDNIDLIQKEYDNFICDYEESMDIRKDENGNEILSSFPESSSYMETGNKFKIKDWVWKRTDNSTNFSFDSEAESEWCSVLQDLADDGFAASVCIVKSITTDLLKETTEKRYLWGKNFLEMSEIRFEYYLNGIHYSYPDFVMKDAFGRIHLFEVKSVNTSSSMSIDKDVYEEKIRALKECYKYASKKTGYIFYLPLMKENEWQITRFVNGEETNISVVTMEKYFSEKST